VWEASRINCSRSHTSHGNCIYYNSRNPYRSVWTTSEIQQHANQGSIVVTSLQIWFVVLFLSHFPYEGSSCWFQSYLNEELILKRRKIVYCVIAFLVFHCMQESIISAKYLDLICLLILEKLTPSTSPSHPMLSRA
jgi:hypothetical protein